MVSESATPVIVTGPLPSAAKLITIAILAMGGEGGGVLSDWIVDIGEHAGYQAQTTSVPGVAQRTGATIYYLELFPRYLSKLAGKPPILALMPVPGEIDVVVASELMEAGRAIDRGLVTADRTTLVTSTHRVYSINERSAMADGRADSETFLEAARNTAHAFFSADFAKLALDAGSVISAALLGGLAGTKVLPFEREEFEAAIRRGGIGVEASLRAFAAGYNVVALPASVEEQQEQVQSVGPALLPLAGRVRETFPVSTHSILLPAIQRLAEYQDVRYAMEYLDRLDPVRDLDMRFGDGRFGLLRETARYLALWLTYEDAIRVADLKTRRVRFERIRKDSRTKPGQVLHISEFLSPQPQEIADLLPTAAGTWLLNSDVLRKLIVRFSEGGTTLRSTSLGGFLLLHTLSKLRPIRRMSLRFHVEREGIERWLKVLSSTASENYTLAEEVAECARLIKGYSDTHTQGKRNFEALVAEVPKLIKRPDGAERLRQLRDAAFADDTGSTLSQSLVQIKL